MKFVFKIWTPYDGFGPEQIADRALAGNRLPLGWERYLDEVETGSEVLVYFFGGDKPAGVYVRGVADEIDHDAGQVLLRMRQFSATAPLTDAETTARIAEIVRPRRRQVFVLPEELDYSPACSVATTAASCKARRCGSCATWQGLPVVKPRNLAWPNHLSSDFEAFVPGYWTVARRSWLIQQGRPRPRIRQTTELFNRFKAGTEELAFPLALAMAEGLAERGLRGFDCVVPVPLSPEKAARGELHRTKALAGELARLVGAPRRELLQLAEPVSKRNLRTGRGFGAAQFEQAYLRRLEVRSGARAVERVLLVDDVCTEGNTLNACLRALRRVHPDIAVVAATAGQMTVKAALKRVNELVEPR